MIKSWIIEGLLSLFTAVTREVIGFNTVLSAASASNLDHNSIAFYHIAWHVITGLCILTSIVFIYIGVHPNRLASSQIAWTLNSIFGSSALIVLSVGLIMGWTSDMIPPVILLTGIALFGSLGALKKRSNLRES